MITKFRGYDIEEINGKTFYCDTKEPTIDTWESRPCGHCGKHLTKEGHDGCLGTLKGVMNACCGHGEPNQAYVQFYDGCSIDGEQAYVILELTKILRKYNME